MLVGPSKYLKQIIQLELTGLRITTGRRQTSCRAIYKHGRGFELQTTVNRQIQLAVRTGLEFGASDFQVQRSNHSATLPPSKCSNG